MDARELRHINFNGYKIFEDGKIWSYKSKKWLKPDLSSRYERVTLIIDNAKIRYLVHRIVGICFIPNPDNKPCINHIDGNPSNNHVSNLEWCTYSENELHSHHVLGKKIIHSEECKRKMSIIAKGRDMSAAIAASAAIRRGSIAYNIVPVMLNGNIMYESITSAAKDNSLSVGAVWNNLNGLSKRTKVGVFTLYNN